MKRLTEKEYWNARYDAMPRSPTAQGPAGGVKAFIKRLLGPRVAEYMRDYCEYQLWDVLYDAHLPRDKGARVLEVGSAPGDHLVQLWRVFGYEPYGIEYSSAGVDLNRRLFQRYGIDPAHVIEGDFFSSEIQDKYQGHFDMVISRGFIEHFTDPGLAIDGHLNVLRTGGHLVIIIPNLRGINYALTRFFNRDLISIHNTSIMRQEAFCRLFSRQELSTVVCRYYGTFNFGLFQARPGSLKQRILPLGQKAQRLLNVLLRVAFGQNGAESAHWSPYLIYIGVKSRQST